MRGTKNLTKPLIAGGVGGVIDAFALPYVQSFVGMSTPVARMLLGSAGQYFMKRKGMLKNGFTAIATVGAFDFGRSLIGGTTNGGTAGKLF